MIFIIEGPDGSGKTTLAEMLSKQTGFPVVHRTQPKSEEEKARMMQEYVATIKTGKNAIFDRCWYSEMAYGPVFRGESCISVDEMHELEGLLHSLGGFVVYCHSENAYERACERGEDYIQNYDQWMRVNMNYNEIFKRTEHKVVVLEYGF